MKHQAELYGVKFYGSLNEGQKAILQEVERVTNREEWEGIKGVYCFDSGYFLRGDDQLIGHYTGVPGGADAAIQFELNDEQINLTDFPVIFVAAAEEQAKPHKFAFVLLHELGHHVDYRNRPGRVPDLRTDEMHAHWFALEKFFQLDTQERLIPNMPYLEEAFEQFKKEMVIEQFKNEIFHSTP